jgi:hypothetical protein
MNKNKEIAKAEAEIDKLKDKLYCLLEADVPPSPEYYQLMRWNIEKSITDLELYIERTLEHDKRMKPLYFTLYVFIFLVSFFITYFLIMY